MPEADSSRQNNSSEENLHHDSADNDDNNLEELAEEDFLKQIRACIDASEPLDLMGRQVTLTRGAIRLKGRDQLTIQGGRIDGRVHSLFQIDGDKRNHPRRLTLHSVTLRHTKAHEDPREIGAAVFCMGSCQVVLRQCDISSQGGFAVWAKHKCHVLVDHCQIHHVARTAVACFNSVHVTVKHSSLEHVGVHGICGRGVSTMELEHVVMRHCRVRAVMVYQGATISLQDCSISHTDDPTTPTIHAQGPVEEEDQDQEETATNPSGSNAASSSQCANERAVLVPTLRMERCSVTDSKGPPLFMEGKVHQEIIECDIPT
ncbi:expressed unknown protein [Seminavis robusta]|uniref:Right handed beta helix domain-containing protein n=1 Tax=Seminavis robusta TaxID=568900 RepID=A0A9N8H7I7_9STRA|nr:expressed unknown protein [Seminavis robusta]|eukprot:Sro130_g061990.1 n/a (317) ;mRNA; f:81742-82692